MTEFPQSTIKHGPAVSTGWDHLIADHTHLPANFALAGLLLVNAVAGQDNLSFK